MNKILAFRIDHVDKVQLRSQPGQQAEQVGLNQPFAVVRHHTDIKVVDMALDKGPQSRSYARTRSIGRVTIKSNDLLAVGNDTGLANGLIRTAGHHTPDVCALSQ